MSIENFIKENKTKIRQIIGNYADNETAQDIEQDVYLKIWKTSSENKSAGYIKTIVVNTCKDFFKTKQYKTSKISSSDEETLLIIKDAKETPHQRTESLFRQKTIYDAINKLPPKLREVIILFDIKEYDQNQIAKKLNCPVGTVKSRLFNARKQLQAELSSLIEGDTL